ncbi:uncharacterized protein DS421_9g268560 [Arachis hypogaea]|nr:uncharacterized protein DS421_9g268560 [Arachis hypogaea]
MFGLSLIYPRAEAYLGVECQVVTCFGRSTLVRDVFLAFDSRMQHGTGVECQFTSSNLEQSMDYYILLESSGCLLFKAVESAAFGVL